MDGSVRLSRRRVLLRVALLLAGGAFMAGRAAQAWSASRRLEGAPAALQARVALVEGLVAALAILTAAAAALTLRARRREPTLRLGGAPPARTPEDRGKCPGEGPGAPPAAAPGAAQDPVVPPRGQ
jgi:hypothetical protein